MLRRRRTACDGNASSDDEAAACAATCVPFPLPATRSDNRTSLLCHGTLSRMTNQLFYGDNLDVLRRKIASASVDHCYIDPPFNSKRNFF